MFRSTRSLVRHIRPTTRLNPIASTTRSLRVYEAKPSVAWQQTVRLASNRRDDPPPPKPQIDYEAERKIGERKLKADPGAVSVDSTTRLRFDNETGLGGSPDESVNEGLKHDVNIVKDTFKLSNIPYESHVLGLAGTIPYFATSLATVYLGWDLTKTLPTGSAFYDTIVINHDTAQYLLNAIEPLQLGYGAIIISFLGAIHWGLEYAEVKPAPQRTRFRYGMGVAASVVAWPTVLMPIEYGLTSQFMAFVGLYFADSRAAKKGWAPRWYGQYRFLLTAMVGLAIFVSLVGRSEIEKSERLSKEYLRASMTRSGIADTETDWAKLEAEEKKKIKEEKERKAKEEKKKKNKSGKKGDSKSDGKDDKSKDDDTDESNDSGKDDSESDQETKTEDKKSKEKDGAEGKEDASNNGEGKDEKEGKDESDKADESKEESKDDKKAKRSK